MIEKLEDIKIFFYQNKKYTNCKHLFLKHKYGLFLKISIFKNQVYDIEFAPRIYLYDEIPLDIHELLFNEKLLYNIFGTDIEKDIDNQTMLKKVFNEFKEFFQKNYINKNGE